MKIDTAAVISLAVGMFAPIIGWACFLGLFSVSDFDVDVVYTSLSEEIIAYTLLAIVTICNPVYHLVGWLDSEPNRIALPDEFYYLSFLVSGVLWAFLSYLFLRLWFMRKAKLTNKTIEA